jgi:hypothetical protein
VDPAPLLGLSPEELACAFTDQKRLLCRIRTNAMPLIVPPDHPAATRLLAANIASDVPTRALPVRADTTLPERLTRATSLIRRDYPKAIYVEDRLCEGGFFRRAPTKAPWLRSTPPIPPTSLRLSMPCRMNGLSRWGGALSITSLLRCSLHRIDH